MLLRSKVQTVIGPSITTWKCD